MKEIKIEKVKIDKIQKHPDNPRTIEESKLEELKQSILEFPQMLELRPIIVEKETNYIIGGNQRHQACKELGHKEVFVIFIEEANKEKIKEFMLKDNMNYGVWNFELLKMFYDQDELIKWGLEDAEYIDFNDEDEDEEIENNYEQEEAGDIQVIKKIVFVLEDKYYDQALNKLLDYSHKNEFSDNTEAILNLIENHNE